MGRPRRDRVRHADKFTNTGKFLGTRIILDALKVPLMFLMPILPSFECRA